MIGFFMFKSIESEEELGEFVYESRLNRKLFLLVKFSTESCLPCKDLQISINKLLISRKDLVVIEVDARKFSNLCSKEEFDVFSVPSVFLFRNGIIVKKNVGKMSIGELEKFIYY